MTTLSGPRTDRRHRELGYIGPLALVVMLMISATALTVFSATAANVNNSRESHNFLIARDNVDQALAAASQSINADGLNGTEPTPPPGGSGPGESDSSGGASQWSWQAAPYTEADLAPNSPFTSWYQLSDSPDRPASLAYRTRLDGRIQAVGETTGTQKTTKTETRAWRTRLVGSYGDDPTKPGRIVYGLPAPAVWDSAAVNTQADSTVAGRVFGDWSAFGNGTVTIASGSQASRVITYDDAAKVADSSGTSVPTLRSALTANLDRKLLRQRLDDPVQCPRNGGATGIGSGRFRSSTAGGTLASSNGVQCFYDFNVDSPLTVVNGGSNTLTVISYGTVRINADITIPAGMNLHLYSLTGSVQFNTDHPVTVGGPDGAAYLFAPNASCRTFGPSVTVRWYGSLACRSVRLLNPGNYVQWVPVLPEYQGPVVSEPSGRAFRYVRYIENPGYNDQFGS